jgi:hypothetical protein
MAPARPAAARLELGRGSTFAAAGVLAALNAQASQILSALNNQPLAEVMLGLAGISAVIWTAMAAAWKIGSEDRRRLSAGADTAVLAMVITLSFLPLSYAAQAGLLLCTAYLFATSRGYQPARRAALVLLALTGPLIWGRILLNLFAGPILNLDAHVVGAVIGTRVDGNTFRAVDGSRFVIGDFCSSVHNISLAIVLWTTAAMLFDIQIDRRYVAIGAAMIGFMFALNIARLSTIGLFPAHFDYLHFGTGAALFGWAGLIGAVLLAGFGVANAADRQR